MESIIINGKRMIPAHGDHGQVLAKTGPMKTSGAFVKCKSDAIMSRNTRALVNGANIRRNLALVKGNGSMPEKTSTKRVYSSGIDPNLGSY